VCTPVEADLGLASIRADDDGLRICPIKVLDAVVVRNSDYKQ